MKTTLHYQLKDFKAFVLDNLERRGYILAAGCEPQMSNLDDMDDPEQVIMEVLVEDRPETLHNQLEITLEAPSYLLPPVEEGEPASAQAPKEKRAKATRTVTEKEAARRLANSERMKTFNASRGNHSVEPVVTESVAEKRVSPNDRAVLAERQVIRDQVVQQRLAQADPKQEPPADTIKKEQKVVATSLTTFPFEPLAASTASNS